MRYPETHKAETKRRIVEVASRAFRTQGFDGPSVPSIMKAASLTHGGFYGHFETRDQLVTEAMIFALEESKGLLLSALREGGVERLAETYTSAQHVENPAFGCPLPSLLGEQGRLDPPSKESFTKHFKELIADIAPFFPGDTEINRTQNARLAITLLAGAVSLARSLDTPEEKAETLRNVRIHLIQHFAS